MFTRHIGFLSLFLISYIDTATSTDTLRKDFLKVHISGEWYDMDFVKTEIPFINYVRDHTVADVHILITAQPTGSGGRAYTLTFNGQHNYKGMNDTLEYISGRLDSEDVIRRGIVKIIKLGLMRYIAHTPIADEILISFQRRESLTISPVDSWKNWIFSISVGGNFNGEQLREYRSFNISLSANRTTEEWKKRFSIYYSHTLQSFKIEENLPPIITTSESYGFTTYIVNSINEHWSIGTWPSVYSSIYNNMRMSFSLGPAIEYNIFPYSEATRRKICIMYIPGYEYNQYYEETLFGKFSEGLPTQTLSIILESIQRWGSIAVTLRGSQYLHDFSKYQITFSNSLSLKLIKGFSFSVSGTTSLIRDQLFLPKRELTPEEILLRIKQLSTNYDYFMYMRLSYSFGSLYSPVVNPRLVHPSRGFVMY
jgi:hypothetical protein